MIAPVWIDGPGDIFPDPGDAPLVWRLRLDDPAVVRAAEGAALREDDLRDLAGRPQAAMRGLRRRLMRVMIARMAQCHPDAIVFGRGPMGEPLILAPEGWHVSVAGRWPHGLIGIARAGLGVDIEPADTLPPPEDALTPGEQAEAPDEHERIRRWTAKEAHAKLYGVASRIDPADIHTWADGALLRARSVSGMSICHTADLGGTFCTVARTA